MEFKTRNKKYIFFICLVIAVFFVVVFTFYYPRTSEIVIVSNLNKEKISQLPQKKTLLVFGDVMLDRSVRSYITASGTASLFEYVQKDITDADATILNLEGPITTYSSVVSKENLQFTFATHTASDLHSLGVDVVSLANNHTHNFGKEGLRQTKEYLDDAGIVSFGDPYNNVLNLVTRYTLGSTTISFVGYHQFENPSIENILIAVRAEKEQGHFVIFFPHWGTEYKVIANDTQNNIAQDVIDAGADIVIGAHPHVIQNGQMYNDKPIFYSLGNFIFDQWFSEDVKYGLALLLTFSEKDLEKIELKPFYRARFQPKWLTEEDRQNWCKKFTQETLFWVDQNDSCILKLR